MKNNKNSIRALMVLAILLVLYCVLVLVIPFERGTVFWLSFVFTLIAFFAQVYILKTAFRHGKSLKSKFYGFPIARVGVIYLSAQLVLSLVFMALGKWIPVWVVVPVYMLILGLSAIGIITTDAVRDEVERQETQKKEDTSFMTNLYLQVSDLAAQCSDYDSKKALEKLAEEVRFSDPVSSEATFLVEKAIDEKIQVLSLAIDEDNGTVIAESIKRLTDVLATRNKTAKITK